MRTHLVELDAVGLDLVCDRERVRHGRDRAADLVEREHELVRDRAGELGLGLVAEADDLDVLALLDGLCDLAARRL